MSKIKIYIAVLTLAGAPVLAQDFYQIAPNPNPSGSTISIDTSVAEKTPTINLCSYSIWNGG